MINGIHACPLPHMHDDRQMSCLNQLMIEINNF